MIGPLLQKIGELIFKHKDTIIKAGKEATKIYTKHHVAINRGIKIAAIAYMQYNTYRAQKYEKELHEKYKKYKKSANERFKTEAKKTINRIQSIIAKQNISQNEKDELNNILTRHARWVNKDSTQKIKKVVKKAAKKVIKKVIKKAAKKAKPAT